MNIWIQVPAAVLAVMALLGLVYKGARVFFKFDAALPVLLGIADEFKPNGGSSLKDHLNRIDTKLTDVDHRLEGVERAVTQKS